MGTPDTKSQCIWCGKIASSRLEKPLCESCVAIPDRISRIERQLSELNTNRFTERNSITEDNDTRRTAIVQCQSHDVNDNGQQPKSTVEPTIISDDDISVFSHGDVSAEDGVFKLAVSVSVLWLPSMTSPLCKN